MTSLIYSHSSSTLKKSLIAVCQLNVSDDRESNFESVKKLVTEAAKRGARMCFLPEAADFIANNSEQSKMMAKQYTTDEVCAKYCDLAKSCKVWLSLCLHLYNESVGKTRNSHIVIDETGIIKSIYDKCHLFDVNIPNKVTLSESNHCQKGSSFADPVNTPVGCVASMICYDLRFPEISTEMRKRGAQILTYPSAFTVATGHAHWEALLRARAIENQCYVIAAAQCGSHNSKRSSYGHSLVVDPWGTVLACAGENAGIFTVDIDINNVDKIRKSMPVFQHRRTDLY